MTPKTINNNCHQWQHGSQPFLVPVILHEVPLHFFPKHDKELICCQRHTAVNTDIWRRRLQFSGYQQ